MRSHRTSKILSIAAAVLTLTSCAAETKEDASKKVSAVDVFDATEAPPAAVLVGRLNTFADRVRSGQDISDMFEGDRLLVITDSGLTEVPAPTNAAGTAVFAAINVEVPETCDAIPCSISVREIFEVLTTDIRLGRFTEPMIDRTSPLGSWPAVAFDSYSRGWTVSFGPDGSTLVAIEVAGSFESR